MCLLASLFLSVGCAAVEEKLETATPVAVTVTQAPAPTVTLAPPTATPEPTPSSTPLSYLRVPDDFASIQEAIDVARDGEVIVVSPGTWQATSLPPAQYMLKSMIEPQLPQNTLIT